MVSVVIVIKELLCYNIYMENKNLGVLIAPPKPKDYILGSTSPLTSDRIIKDWSIYLPSPESQRNKITDFMDCVTMSALHAIGTQLNYLLMNNKLSDEALYFFHNNGYIKDGLFSLSSRFNAKLNNTENLKGNYLNNVGDCIRRDGLISNSDWPTMDDTSYDEFYMMIPVGLFTKAKKALWFVDIKYQWVNKSDFPSILKVSPVQVGTEICNGWGTGQTVQKCSGQPLQHATMMYHVNDDGTYADFDQYPPFKQNLASDYEFPLNLEYIVTVKPLMLRKGMHGENVLKLQQDLNKLGFILTEDSDFGPKTEIQVKSLQNKIGLVSDGIAGPKTLSKLNSLTGMNTIEEIIKETALEEGIEPELAVAVAKCEGGITNAKITRQNTDSHHSIDRGVFQFNSYWHKEVTDEEAFDPKLATIAFCNIVKSGGLDATWYLSEPNWKKLVSADILAKYGIH